MDDLLKQPLPFLSVRVHENLISVGLTALCAGYEQSQWRAEQLASHLLEWLLEFALTHSELASLGTHNAMRLVMRAAAAVYDTAKVDSKDVGARGEIGELLLHCAIRQVYKTVPAISKFYYKDSANDTVKGFDAVHVVVSETDLELWLGEAKFYKNISSAITAAVDELEKHTKRDYLRSEFAAITNKIDDAWPYSERLKLLIDKNRSLDEIFDSVTVPVFLTYESPVITSYSEISAQFEAAFRKEVLVHHRSFSSKPLPKHLTVRLFLFPMASKDKLVSFFDEKLRAWQRMN